MYENYTDRVNISVFFCCCCKQSHLCGQMKESDCNSVLFLLPFSRMAKARRAAKDQVHAQKRNQKEEPAGRSTCGLPNSSDA